MSISFSTIVQRVRPATQHAASKSFRDLLFRIPPTNVTALSNGFRVAAEENPLSPYATVGLWMDAGSKYEQRHINGTARMLEVCGFLGTTNQTRSQIAQAVEELGGHLGVKTGREHSYLYLKVRKEDVPRAVGLLADVVRNARLDDEDVVLARKEVDKARLQFDEDVDAMVDDNLHICAFDATETGGLGMPVNGSELTLPTITKKDLKEFRETHYKPGRMVLVGSGAVNTTQLEKLAKDSFGDMQASASNVKPKINSRFVGGDYRMWNLRFKTAHVTWAFETCGANSCDVVPLNLVRHVFGDFHRSQHDLGQHTMHRVLKCYSSMDHGTPTDTHFPAEGFETANSFLTLYEDIGLCGMRIVGRPWKITPSGPETTMQEYLHLTMQEWARLTQRNIVPNEFEQAKVNYKSQLLFNMDGATNTAEDIGRQVLHHGRRVGLEEMFDRIDDVTATNVQETMQHYYYARRPVFSMAGYIYILPAYDWIAQWTWRYAF